MKHEMYDQQIRAAAAKPIPPSLERVNVELVLENTLCGDWISLQAQLEGNIFLSVRADVEGCLLCRAAASLISEKASGLTCSVAIDLLGAVSAFLEGRSNEVLEFWPELNMFSPVVDHVARRKCVLLAFQALEKAGRSHDI